MNFFYQQAPGRAQICLTVQQKKLQQIIHEVQGRKWLIGLNCFSCVHYSLIKRPINLARVVSDISFWFWLSGGSFNVWNFCLFPTVDSGNVNLMDGNFWSWKPTQIKDIATLLYLKGDKFFKETMVQRRWGSLKKIWVYQLSWWWKLAAVKSFKADVSS